MSEIRLRRVENLIRDQVSGLIMKGVIKDPRVDTLLSVTHVKVSKDTAHAVVSISSIQSDQTVQKAVDALNHAAGFIQHKLRGKLHLKNTPILKFIKDNTIEESFKIVRKLNELKPGPEDSYTSRDN